MPSRATAQHGCLSLSGQESSESDLLLEADTMSDTLSCPPPHNGETRKTEARKSEGSSDRPVHVKLITIL